MIHAEEKCPDFTKESGTSEVFAKLSSKRQFNLNELAFISISPATHLAIIQVDKGCLKAKLVKQQELKET